jgi:Phosphoglycerate kinase
MFFLACSTCCIPYIVLHCPAWNCSEVTVLLYAKLSCTLRTYFQVDKLVLGGGMVFTFLKARGVDVGNSLVEDDQVKCAHEHCAVDRQTLLVMGDMDRQIARVI